MKKFRTAILSTTLLEAGFETEGALSDEIIRFEERSRPGERFSRCKVKLHSLMTLWVLLPPKGQQKGGIADSTAFIRWIWHGIRGQTDSIRLMTEFPGTR